MNKSAKFVIVSSRPDSGGTIVLHTLYKCLEKLDYDVRIFYIGNFKSGKSIIRKIYFWVRLILYYIQDCFIVILSRIDSKDKRMYDGYRNPTYKKCKRKILPFVSNDTIVVYPEVIYGNPLHAKKVVRWFLYYNRFANDSGAYGKSDYFICYRQLFNDNNLNHLKTELCINYFDLNLYKRTNYGERHGNCYIIRKGKNRQDIPNSFDGVVVDDLSEKNKVRVFNSSLYCISYDTQTSYSGIAALCGCISIVVPEAGKTRKDYLTENEHGYGRAYGFDESEIKYAVETADKIRFIYEKLNNDSIEKTKIFVNDCLIYFDMENDSKNSY